MSGRSEDQSNHVQSDHERKEFPSEYDRKQNQKRG